MRKVPFALYDAFSDLPFGGSQAAIVTDAAELDTATRRNIARELGMPATVFVDGYGHGWVSAQFMSAVMELPMCGHGTVCLLTRLVEPGYMTWNREGAYAVDLRLPVGRAGVELTVDTGGRVQVMLEVKPPLPARFPADRVALSALLGCGDDDLSEDLPVEIVHGDFEHLVVPVNGLEAIRRIKPDLQGMVHFCNQNNIETIAVCCLETERPDSTVHVRDFCPAVGVAESAGAGTTNAAVAAYLVSHGRVKPDSRGKIEITAEQGHEIGRPGSIHTVIQMKDDRLPRLQVGGVATKVMEGHLLI